MRPLITLAAAFIIAAHARAQCTDEAAYIFAKVFLSQEINDRRAAFEPQPAALIGWSGDTATIRLLAYLPGRGDPPITRSITAQLICRNGGLDYYIVLVDGRIGYIRP